MPRNAKPPSMRVPTRQVFINCPFDETYHPFIEAATFPILACGYIPRCALEFGDTGYARLSRITDLIDQCDFSLHDISVPRFNMPFELGLAWGRKRKTSNKKILVIRLDLHSHERSFSDLKALDPVSHSGDPLELVTQVRNWLSSHQAILLNAPNISRTGINVSKSLFLTSVPNQAFTAADLLRPTKTLCTAPFSGSNSKSPPLNLS